MRSAFTGGIAIMHEANKPRELPFKRVANAAPANFRRAQATACSAVPVSFFIDLFPDRVNWSMRTT